MQLCGQMISAVLMPCVVYSFFLCWNYIQMSWLQSIQADKLLVDCLSALLMTLLERDFASYFKIATSECSCSTFASDQNGSSALTEGGVPMDTSVILSAS